MSKSDDWQVPLTPKIIFREQAPLNFDRFHIVDVTKAQAGSALAGPALAWQVLLWSVLFIG